MALTNGFFGALIVWNALISAEESGRSLREIILPVVFMIGRRKNESVEKIRSMQPSVLNNFVLLS